MSIKKEFPLPKKLVIPDIDKLYKTGIERSAEIKGISTKKIETSK